MAELSEFDLVIVGAGAAGLAAAIYALRAGLKTVCIEKGVAGGHAVLIEKIENYPGFAGISGLELMKNFEAQAKNYGLKIIHADVVSIVDSKGLACASQCLQTVVSKPNAENNACSASPRLKAWVPKPFDSGKKKIVKTNKQDFFAKAVIVAAGSSPKELGLKNEKELVGKGIHYCALCDGPLYAKKRVVVVGGGNSAIEEAVFLSKIASKVSVVHRRSALRADSILQERAFKAKNIEWLFDSEIIELAGEKKLEKIVLRNNNTGKQTSLITDALFVYIGRTPNTDFLDVKKSDAGMIIVDSKMQTSVPGIFAAGDCIEKRVWQIATCVAEGAIAAVSAREYIDSLA